MSLWDAFRLWKQLVKAGLDEVRLGLRMMRGEQL